MRRGSDDYYFHADDHYNVFALTDDSGAVVERYDYGDFGLPEFYAPDGTPRTESAFQNPYLFTGRRWDAELGLYYYRARHMDPAAGRFLSRDPLGLWGDPMNLGVGSAYAGGNPWTYGDAFGLETDMADLYLGISLNTGGNIDPGQVPRMHFNMGIGAVDEVTNRAAATVLEYGSEEAIMLPLTVGTGGGARAVQPVAKPGMIKRAWRATAGFAAAGWAKVKAFPGAVGRWWRGPADEAVEIVDTIPHSTLPDELLLTGWTTSRELRYSAGVVTGGENLAVVSGRWLLGTHANAGRIPGQVARRLQGRTFNNFDEFRQEFWLTVADTPELANQFSARDVLRMSKGYAPIAPSEQQLGEQVTYIIHHSIPIFRGGDVYSLENMWIVTPRFHKEALGREFHFGR